MPLQPSPSDPLLVFFLSASQFDLIWLSISAFATSALAGLLGLGGGMIMLAIAPILLPISAIIPIHACSQLASNTSRALFSFGAIAWGLLPAFIIGAVAGTALTWLLLRNITLDILPVFIAGYMLASLWSKQFNALLKRYVNLYFIGALQTGLGLLVGATGPLTTTALLTQLHLPEGTERINTIISTNAALMAVSHGIKIAIFAALGFSFSAYWQTIAAMAVAAILGSYVGTKVRVRLSSRSLHTALKVGLTLLALRMLWQVLCLKF